MSNMLKCPNPSCPYAFDPSQVPVGVVLSCPRCGMQFTLGPPAPAPAAAAAPSYPSTPAGYPPGYGAPAAPPAELPNAELEEVGRKAVEERDPDAPLPGRRTNKAQVFILAGIAAVLMAGTVLAIVFKLMHKPEDETGDGLTKIPDINLAIGAFPPEWKHDDTKKNEFGSPYVRSYRREGTEAYMVLGAYEPGKNVKRMPLPSELYRNLRKPLHKYFKIASFDESLPLQDTKWLDQPIAPGHGFTFRGQSQDDLGWKGEACAVAYKGFAYFWISWCGEADFDKLQPEFAAMRGKFKFIDKREEWKSAGVLSTDYKGDKVPYTISDATLSETEQTWKEVRADEYPALKKIDPDLDRRLRLSITPEGDRKARPDVGELSVFILDGNADPLQAARKYVEDRETARIRAAGIDMPPTFKELTDPPAGDPIQTDVPSTTPVVRLLSEVPNSKSSNRLIVASGLKVGDKIVVVECWCEAVRRGIFETKFIQIASSLR
jgi:hypothetical protein